MLQVVGWWNVRYKVKYISDSPRTVVTYSNSYDDAVRYAKNLLTNNSNVLSTILTTMFEDGDIIKIELFKREDFHRTYYSSLERRV